MNDDAQEAALGLLGLTPTNLVDSTNPLTANIAHTTTPLDANHNPNTDTTPHDTNHKTTPLDTNHKTNRVGIAKPSPLIGGEKMVPSKRKAVHLDVEEEVLPPASIQRTTSKDRAASSSSTTLNRPPAASSSRPPSSTANRPPQSSTRPPTSSSTRPPNSSTKPPRGSLATAPPLATASSQDPDTTPIDTNAIRCICGSTFDDGFSIACDICERWCHAACFDIVEGRVPEEWRCWECSPRPVDFARAARLQKERVRIILDAQAVGGREAQSLCYSIQMQGQGLGQGGRGGAGGLGTPGPRRRASPGSAVVEKDGRRRRAAAASGDGGSHKRRRRNSTHHTLTPVLPTVVVNGAHGHTEDTPPTDIIDVEEAWSSSYVHVSKDIVPSEETRKKLWEEAQKWRGVSAFSTSLDSGAPVVLPKETIEHPPNLAVRSLDPQTSVHPALSFSSSNHSVRPPTFALHTTTPIPSHSFISPYTSVLTPSRHYVEDVLNGYASTGLPKPFVHLLGKPWDLALDSRMVGCEGRFVRSGCRPNAVLRPVICEDAAVSTRSSASSRKRRKSSNSKGRDKDGGGKDKDGGNGEDVEEEEEAPLKFGLFALRDLKENEEVVLGWEWDDGNVVHTLPAVVESPWMFNTLRSAFSSLASSCGDSISTTHPTSNLRHSSTNNPYDDHNSTDHNSTDYSNSSTQLAQLRSQIANILHALSSTFTTCACGARSKECAFTLMGRFVSGEVPEFLGGGFGRGEEAREFSDGRCGRGECSRSRERVGDRGEDREGVREVEGEGEFREGSSKDGEDGGVLRGGLGSKRGCRTRERVVGSGGLGGLEVVDLTDGGLEGEGRRRAGKGKERAVDGGGDGERERVGRRRRASSRSRHDGNADVESVSGSPLVDTRELRPPDPDRMDVDDGEPAISARGRRLSVERAEGDRRDDAVVEGESESDRPPVEEDMPPKMRKRWMHRALGALREKLGREEMSSMTTTDGPPVSTSSTINGPPPPTSSTTNGPPPSTSSVLHDAQLLHPPPPPSSPSSAGTDVEMEVDVGRGGVSPATSFARMSLVSPRPEPEPDKTTVESEPETPASANHLNPTSIGRLERPTSPNHPRNSNRPNPLERPTSIDHEKRTVESENEEVERMPPPPTPKKRARASATLPAIPKSPVKRRGRKSGAAAGAGRRKARRVVVVEEEEGAEEGEDEAGRSTVESEDEDDGEQGPRLQHPAKPEVAKQSEVRSDGEDHDEDDESHLHLVPQDPNEIIPDTPMSPSPTPEALSSEEDDGGDEADEAVVVVEREEEEREETPTKAMTKKKGAAATSKAASKTAKGRGRVSSAREKVEEEVSTSTVPKGKAVKTPKANESGKKTKAKATGGVKVKARRRTIVSDESSEEKEDVPSRDEPPPRDEVLSRDEVSVPSRDPTPKHATVPSRAASKSATESPAYSPSSHVIELGTAARASTVDEPALFSACFCSRVDRADRNEGEKMDVDGVEKEPPTPLSPTWSVGEKDQEKDESAKDGRASTTNVEGALAGGGGIRSAPMDIDLDARSRSASVIPGLDVGVQKRVNGGVNGSSDSTSTTATAGATNPSSDPGSLSEGTATGTGVASIPIVPAPVREPTPPPPPPPKVKMTLKDFAMRKRKQRLEEEKMGGLKDKENQGVANVGEGGKEIGKGKEGVVKEVEMKDDSRKEDKAMKADEVKRSPTIAPASPSTTTWESPAVSRASPSTFRESPSVSRASPSSARDSPAIARDSPAIARESPSIARESPAMPRDSPLITPLSPRPPRGWSDWSAPSPGFGSVDSPTPGGYGFGSTGIGSGYGVGSPSNLLLAGSASTSATPAATTTTTTTTGERPRDTRPAFEKPVLSLSSLISSPPRSSAMPSSLSSASTIVASAPLAVASAPTSVFSSSAFGAPTPGMESTAATAMYDYYSQFGPDGEEYGARKGEEKEEKRDSGEASKEGEKDGASAVAADSKNGREEKDDDAVSLGDEEEEGEDVSGRIPVQSTPARVGAIPNTTTSKAMQPPPTAPRGGIPSMGARRTTPTPIPSAPRGRSRDARTPSGPAAFREGTRWDRDRDVNGRGRSASVHASSPPPPSSGLAAPPPPQSAPAFTRVGAPSASPSTATTAANTTATTTTTATPTAPRPKTIPTGPRSWAQSQAQGNPPSTRWGSPTSSSGGPPYGRGSFSSYRDSGYGRDRDGPYRDSYSYRDRDRDRDRSVYRDFVRGDREREGGGGGLVSSASVGWGLSGRPPPAAPRALREREESRYGGRK
ncbi:hypothetical protein CC1G_15232 [Coprinopsis cinerea okayama7|uniref:PHD-type domain-containing protein n=1 Tax=Coprinopsis cinerea (strain Okayama-7 / 130 / ATCC MYA-4618 / FGSC 9003) TaxID=240176 RepID=D6RQ46_COPC7|nr:hypothetical protein CC1G_15232 [Coprinopsis cinerea okayama7\|eukprot:XP_002910324.1 hypothetical protein CC1G_15232 [Coprinopsis cinerea okayama7\